MLTITKPTPLLINFYFLFFLSFFSPHLLAHFIIDDLYEDLCKYSLESKLVDITSLADFRNFVRNSGAQVMKDDQGAIFSLLVEKHLLGKKIATIMSQEPLYPYTGNAVKRQTQWPAQALSELNQLTDWSEVFQSEN